MSNIYLFNDGSSIEWINREGLKYIENGFSVLIWVDFASGFFSKRRIIKLSSIKYWNNKPNGCSDVINKNKKKEIISKAQQYYQSQNRKCYIEE